MTKENQATKVPAANKTQQKPQPALEQTGGELALAEPGNGPLGVADTPNLQGQARRLGDPRLHAIQRQMLANRIGQIQGNGHLQHLIVSLKHDGVAQAPLLQVQGGFKSIIQRGDPPDAGIANRPIPQPSATTAPAAQATPGLSPEAAHQLAYAATVLRDVPRPPEAEEQRLNTMIGYSDVYQMIHERNEKRSQLEEKRQWLTYYRNTNEAVARGEELEAGVPLGQEDMDRLTNEVANLNTQIEQLNERIQANLQLVGVNSEEELLHAVEVEFPQRWLQRAKQIAYTMLNQNEQLALAERNRYSDQVCSPDIEGILEADRTLAVLDQNIQSLRISINQAQMYVSGVSGGVPQTAADYGIPANQESIMYDIQHLPELRERLPEREAEYSALRAEKGIRFPILLAQGYQPGMFAQAEPEQLGIVVGRPIQEILDNIATTRANIDDDTIKVWDLRDVPEMTYQSLGVREDSIFGTAVHRYIEGRQSDEHWLSIARAVLEIGIVIAATIAAGPLGGALVGGALTLGHLANDVQQYQAESAASHVALDPIVADISLHEPELMPIVLDVVMLGLDVGLVMSALRPAASALVATGEIEEFAAQVRRVAPEASEELIERAQRRFISGCFVAGTQVCTISGTRAIETLSVGDEVLSCDPISGVYAIQRIVQNFVRSVPIVLDIQLGTTTITCSPEHPFWVPKIGWQKARMLKPGTALLTQNGDTVEVQAIERHEGIFRVYNLAVEGMSTYYVGDPGVLVHNKAARLRPDPLVEDIFANPQQLIGKAPSDIEHIIQEAEAAGWSRGTLGRGSRQGQGLVLREIGPNGEPTGRMIQWHPGGGHHGAEPYWKVSSGLGGTVRVGPQFPQGGGT